MSQADLDALFPGGGEADDAGAPPEAAPAEAESASDASGTVSQADLDALFPGGGQADDAEEPPEAAPAEAESAPDASGTVSQADLDALFTGGEDEAGTETETETVSAEAAVMEADNGDIVRIDAATSASPETDDEGADAADSEPESDPVDRLIADLAANPGIPGTDRSPDRPSPDDPQPADAPIPSDPGGDESPGEDFVGLEDAETEMAGYDSEESVDIPTGPAHEEKSGEVTVLPSDEEKPPAVPRGKKKVSARADGTAGKGGLRVVLIVMAAVLLTVGGIGGWVLYEKYKTVTSTRKPVSQAASETVKGPAPSATAEPKPEPHEARAQGPPVPSGIQQALAELDAMRGRMMAKKAEIDALKSDYREKAGRVREEIRNEARRRGIKTLKAALADREIELAMKTVQRRLAYARKLDEPAARLSEGAEALLFVKRLTEIDWRLADVTRGLDAGILEKRMGEAMARHRLDLGDLLVDISAKDYPSLEEIWKSVDVPGEKRSTPAPDAPVSSGLSAEKVATDDSGAVSDNTRILDAIAAGNFENVFHLKQLTPEAARILSTWRNRELFLNGLSHLSSQEAAYLAKWPGDWLALNGLKELPADQARHLMNWTGKRLSLNGIEEIGTETARYLAQWRGGQIELIGLKRLAPEAASLLSQWQRNGGRVFAPERFKRRRAQVSGGDRKTPAPEETR